VYLNAIAAAVGRSKVARNGTHTLPKEICQ